MLKNPLLLREFRQRMRTSRAPYIITGYLASMTLLTFFLLYENVQGQLLMFQPSRSEQVFFALSLLQMTVVAFFTPAFAAGSMSGERERRTLAVLLTTPLSPIRILIGKILSSSALLGLLLVVTLPLYSLVFLFGGAVPQEVIGVFAFQLFTIVLVAAFSVLWSTLTLRSGWSTVLSYGMVTWMLIITGVVGYGLKLMAHNPLEAFADKWGTFLLNLNPLYIEAAIENAVPGVAESGASSPWVSFIVFYLVVFFILAIPSIWRLRPKTFRFVPKAWRTDERNYQ